MPSAYPCYISLPSDANATELLTTSHTPQPGSPQHPVSFALTDEENELRGRVLDLAAELPSSPYALSKEQIRALHSEKRRALVSATNGAFDDHVRLLQGHLAHPDEIHIPSIEPALITVRARTPDSRLFTAASLLWSVPVSKGFGRRIRYLVRDRNNRKLIGLIGLTDPVFNLTPRDAWVGWSAADRAQRLVHTMDAFVLGALPPYSRILGGKLVALLATSSTVVNYFRRKYRASVGIITSTRKSPRLVLLTTSSALGRSSLYNRLRLPDGVAFLTGVDTHRVPTWYTKGYGHFHIPDHIFAGLHRVLLRRDHPYARGNRFGDGPSWRIRVIRQAMAELDVDVDLLQHGVRRQVYVVPLARNTREILLGSNERPAYITQTVGETAEYWRTRWAMPRSQRHSQWRDWHPDDEIDNLRRLHSPAQNNGARTCH